MASLSHVYESSLPPALRDQEKSAREAGRLDPFAEAQALFDACGAGGNWRPAVRGARVLANAIYAKRGGLTAGRRLSLLPRRVAALMLAFFV